MKRTPRCSLAMPARVRWPRDGAGQAGARRRRAYLQELEQRGLIDKTRGDPERAGRRGARAPTTSWSPASPRPRRRASTPSSRVRATRTSPTPRTSRTPSIGSAWRWRAAAASPPRGATSCARSAAAPRRPTTTPRCAPTSTSASTSSWPQSCAAEIDKLGAEDVNEELAYLRGRALYEGDHFERRRGRARRA